PHGGGDQPGLQCDPLRRVGAHSARSGALGGTAADLLVRGGRSALCASAVHLNASPKPCRARKSPPRGQPNQASLVPRLRPNSPVGLFAGRLSSKNPPTLFSYSTGTAGFSSSTGPGKPW